MPRTVAASAFALALVAITALSSGRGTTAQYATPAVVAEHPLVGAWRIIPDPSGPPVVLIVYHADGTLTYSAPSSSPAPPNAPFAVAFDTPAYGVWQPTGPRTAVLSAYAIETDASGTFLGTLGFHGTVELDASQDRYVFRGTVEPTDAQGTVLGTFPVSTRATRIRADLVRAAATLVAGTPMP